MQTVDSSPYADIQASEERGVQRGSAPLREVPGCPSQKSPSLFLSKISTKSTISGSYE